MRENRPAKIPAVATDGSRQRGRPLRQTAPERRSRNVIAPGPVSNPARRAEADRAYLRGARAPSPRGDSPRSTPRLRSTAAAMGPMALAAVQGGTPATPAAPRPNRARRRRNGRAAACDGRTRPGPPWPQQDAGIGCEDGAGQRRARDENSPQRSRTARGPSARTSEPSTTNKRRSAKVLKITSVHTPIDIAERHLKTRSMLRNRVGRPRSQIKRHGETRRPQRPRRAPPARSERLSGEETRQCDHAAHAGRAADEQVQTDLPRPHRRLDNRLSVVAR